MTHSPQKPLDFRIYNVPAGSPLSQIRSHLDGRGFRRTGYTESQDVGCWFEYWDRSGDDSGAVIIHADPHGGFELFTLDSYHDAEEFNIRETLNKIK